MNCDILANKTWLAKEKVRKIHSLLTIIYSGVVNSVGFFLPRHLLTIDDAEILKKVVLHSVATAFASIVWSKRIEFQ